MVLVIYPLTHSFFFSEAVSDLSEMESLQFDFGAIEAATKMFSDENKIGQGGYGAVYKVHIL